MAKIDPEEPCPCESGLLFKECHGPKVRKVECPEITKEVSLKVIPEPDPNTRAVFEKINEGTVIFNGNEVGLAHICGSCGSHLIIGVPSEKINNVVLKCNRCGAFNEV